MLVRRTLPALIALTVALGGCKKPEVQSYRVAKETPPPAGTPAVNAPAANTPAPAATPMSGTPVPTASGAALAWTAPAHWTAKDPGGMRKGSYTVKGTGGDGDMSIMAFPGDVGGDLANINRWRGQIGLGPIAEAELASTTQHLDRNGLHITLAVVNGAGAQGILGAIVPHGDATWFFKLTGPAALVAKEQAAFTAFLDTVKPGAQ